MTGLNEQGQPTWRTYQFPVGGTLRGPLVWAEGEAKSRKELILYAYGGVTTFFGFASGLASVAAYIGLMSQILRHFPKNESSWVYAVISLALFVGFWVALFGGGALGAAGVKTWVARKLNKGDAAFAEVTKYYERITLNQRMKDMSGYLVGSSTTGATQIPAPQVNIDVQIARALADYRPAWRKAEAQKDEIDRGTFQMLAHSAALIGNLETRISRAPELLQNDEIRTSFRDLIARAKGDVELALGRQRIAAETSVLADIKMLERQLDERLGTPCRETAA